MEHVLDTCDRLNDRQFLVAVKRLADSINFGMDRSPFIGSGIEYVQSRPYQPGDSVKSIDWRVTARLGKVYIKEFEATKQLPMYLLLDTSASMTVSSVSRSKYSMAVHLAGGLAFAGLDRVSPVGLIGTGDRAIRIEPSLSRTRILQWMHQLRRYRLDERTTLSDRLHELSTTLPNRALVIILSDLHEPEALPALKLMGQRHDCAVIQLQDPAEASLAGSGFFRGREAETGAEFVAHGQSRHMDTAPLHAELKRHRVDHLLLRTDQPVEHPIRQFFSMRGLAGKAAR
ncbi:MAG: DUF58 domain-containing protein [Verrucomicrobia bacterium]|jgi:uncharacterized protein (DUF58 family)|nr:DUF58 domain-containing protein [Verrucomicrobiota bacterium]